MLEFFCVPLYIEFLSDLHEKFQVASIYDTNIECKIWNFCCNLFLRCAEIRRTHKPTAKNVIFWIQGSSKRVNPFQKNTFSIMYKWEKLIKQKKHFLIKRSIKKVRLHTHTQKKTPHKIGRIFFFLLQNFISLALPLEKKKKLEKDIF